MLIHKLLSILSAQDTAAVATADACVLMYDAVGLNGRIDAEIVRVRILAVQLVKVVIKQENTFGSKSNIN